MSLDSQNAIASDATVPVEDLAEWLCVTPRRVQQLEKKGIVMKDGHGAYRLRDSIQGYIREMNAKADGKNSEYHKERTKKMKIDRQNAEVEYLERIGKLVSTEGVERAIQRVKATEKQQLIFMPKQLTPRLDGDPGINEPILEEWRDQFMKNQAEIKFNEVAPIQAVDHAQRKKA